MNKTVLVVFLLLVSAVMGYLTYNSVNSEIEYRARVKEVDKMIIGRLDTLRRMQLAYRDMNGKFAKTFDELFAYMKFGKYVKLKQVGENDGEVNTARVDSLFVNPMEEILGSSALNIELYKKVPPMDTAVFLIDAGTILQNNVEVPVFEISDPHPFNKKNKALKVGDMRNAITNGNWK